MHDMFKPLEIRVLGCMIEKELTTPEYYPLTLNALTLACNQKNNRHPVLELPEDEVKTAMLALQQQKLCHTVYLHRSRSGRYKHHFDEVYGFSLEEKAVLCELFLRGPQTPGELHTHAARMAVLTGIEQVESILDRLASRQDGPFVKLLERQPGQKESRYGHLFCGEAGLEALAADTRGASPVTDRLEALLRRVEQLEAQVSRLTDIIESLQDDVDPGT